MTGVSSTGCIFQKPNLRTQAKAELCITEKQSRLSAVPPPEANLKEKKRGTNAMALTRARVRNPKYADTPVWGCRKEHDRFDRI